MADIRKAMAPEVPPKLPANVTEPGTTEPDAVPQPKPQPEPESQPLPAHPVTQIADVVPSIQIDLYRKMDKM